MPPSSESPAGVWKRCSKCNKLEGQDQKQPPFRACASCAKAGVVKLYCDKTCQRADWKLHKPYCALKVAAPSTISHLDVPARLRLSRQIEKWMNANMRLLTWVLHQQWSALKTAKDDDTMIVFVGKGLAKGLQGAHIPKMEEPKVWTLSDAAVRRLFRKQEPEMYANTGRAMAVWVEPLKQIVAVRMHEVTDALHKACAMLAAPCPNWKFVFEDVVDAQVQSLEESNMTLRAEVARRRAWELFVGEDTASAAGRMPTLDALESDATWWRDSNWIDHPQFVEWYTKEFRRSPLEALATMRVSDITDSSKKVHLQRLHDWVAMAAPVRRGALKRMPMTTEGYLSRPAYIE